MDKSYERMFRHVFTPILDRYGVLQQDRPYIMAFYIRGLMAIISEWLKNDCADSITYVTGVSQQCVKMPQNETTNAVRQLPICETQVYFSSILSKSRLIFLRIKYVQEIMREINSVTAV